MAITKFDRDFKPVKRKLITFSGTVKEDAAFVARKVCLYNQADNELVDSTMSSAVDGTWLIEVSDNINNKYVAVCVPIAGDVNAEVFANLTGI